VRYPFIPIEMTVIKKTIRTVGKHVKKLEPSCIAGRNIKWCSHFGKQFGSSSKSERVTI